MAEELRAYTPSLRERLTATIFGALGGEGRAGWRNAERLTDALDLTPVGAATTAYDAGRGLASGADQGSPAGMAGGGAMLAMSLIPGSQAGRKAFQATAKPIRAYHGSPHDFDRFDMSKIGTGEGAQAYGHGLYFAEAEPVARMYRDKLTPARKGASISERMRGLTMGDKPLAERFDIDESFADQFVDTLQLGGQKALRSEFLDRLARWRRQADDPDYPFRDYAQEKVRAYDGAIRAMDSGEEVRLPGRMYEVDIKADPGDFLDWDKPVHQQSERVIGALGHSPQDIAAYKEISKTYDDLLYRSLNGEEGLEDQMSGLLKQMNKYSALEKRGSDIVKGGSVFDRPIDAADAGRLRDAGIPGIKYLDQGSRSAGEGSRNFVLFRDDIIDIIRKYGIAGAATMLGLPQAEVAEAAQQQNTPVFGALSP